MPVSPAEIQTRLAGVEYPAHKGDLLEAARLEGAGDDVLEILEGIEDREYTDPTDVMRSVDGSL